MMVPGGMERLVIMGVVGGVLWVAVTMRHGVCLVGDSDEGWLCGAAGVLLRGSAASHHWGARGAAMDSCGFEWRGEG